MSLVTIAFRLESRFGPTRPTRLSRRSSRSSQSPFGSSHDLDSVRLAWQASRRKSSHNRLSARVTIWTVSARADITPERVEESQSPFGSSHDLDPKTSLWGAKNLHLCHNRLSARVTIWTHVREGFGHHEPGPSQSPFGSSHDLDLTGQVLSCA